MNSEHEKMHDTPRTPPPDTHAPTEIDPPGAANQNAPHGAATGASPGASAGAAPSPDALMQAATARIAELEAEVAELKDRWMRSEAEIANVRARVPPRGGRDPAIRGAEIRHRRGGGGGEPAARPRQPAGRPSRTSRRSSASCARAWKASSAASSALLERNGIKREDPTGKPFDPNLHQAMAEQESEAHPAGHGDAGLDPGLDPERPAAAAGDGGRRQGARRGTDRRGPSGGETGHDGLNAAHDCSRIGEKPCRV